LIIGFLEADGLAEEVIQQYVSYADMFEKLLSAADPQLAFQTYQVTEQQYPQDETGLEQVLGSSITYHIAVGPQQGHNTES
jgi:hypothetical protein